MVFYLIFLAIWTLLIFSIGFVVGFCFKEEK